MNVNISDDIFRLGNTQLCKLCKIFLAVNLNIKGDISSHSYNHFFKRTSLAAAIDFLGPTSKKYIVNLLWWCDSFIQCCLFNLLLDLS